MTDNVARETAASKRGAEFSHLKMQGLSYGQIAKRHGVSRSAVAGAIHRHDKADAVSAYKKNWYETIRQENRAKFIKRRLEKVEGFTPRNAREQQILALYISDELLSTEVIGDRFGISGQRVREILNRRKSAYRIAVEERNARIVSAYENGASTVAIARDEHLSESATLDIIRRAGKSRRKGKPTRDLAGQRFGLLVATECAGRLKGSRENYWRCACDCGGTVTTRRSCLVDGFTKSCGCLGRGPKSKYAVAA
jgi:predicted DNA-binding protein YlxM (UPF0122 family)